MSATKEVKALLDELRGKLDKDQAAYLEPILRKILEAAKPKTITKVEYRSDPRDKEEIESLRAEIHAKDEAIRNLQFKLAAPPPLDHDTVSPGNHHFVRCVVGAGLGVVDRTHIGGSLLFVLFACRGPDSIRRHPGPRRTSPLVWPGLHDLHEPCICCGCVHRLPLTRRRRGPDVFP